ncbi:MAG: flagellar motor switch protein FliM [Gammaproteobacteria bacterium]
MAEETDENPTPGEPDAEGEEQPVLSDAEVGALLEGVADGAVSTGDGVGLPGEATAYEFASNAHVSSYCPAPLVNLYNRLSRRIRSALYELLREDVTIELDALRRHRYDDYLAELNEPVSVNVISEPSLPGFGLVVFDATLIVTLVNRYYGGADAAVTDDGPRALTPAEMRMGETCLTMILAQLNDVWANIADVTFRPTSVETSPQLVTVAGTSDSMLVARFAVTIGEATGACHLVMPLEMLVPLRAKLAASGQGRLAGRNQFMARVREHLHDVDVEMVCTLGQLSLPLREVIAMAPGDILPIDLPPQAVLTVDGSEVLFGRFGKSRGINALCVNRREIHSSPTQKDLA